MGQGQEERKSQEKGIKQDTGLISHYSFSKRFSHHPKLRADHMLFLSSKPLHILFLPPGMLHFAYHDDSCSLLRY